MRRLSLIATLLCVGLVFAPQVWGQGGTGQLSGTVQDESGAFIPGVEVTAVNAGTNVSTTAISNASGAYNIQALQVGTYTLTAALPGFQTQAYENIDLGGEPLRYNFTMTVAAAGIEELVTIDAQDLLTQSGGTVGDVLPAYRVTELPLVGNDVLDLIGVLGGTRLSAFGADSNFTTLAGIEASYVNTTVNGISVNDPRYSGAAGAGGMISGIYSTTRINPDLVQEVRLILTPVDAEMGRGNSQIQINTRSGTNDFQGTARWDNRNPALNARSWYDNRNPNGPPTEDWYNQNQFSFSYGGPIIRGKTFFFALWDQNVNRTRTNVVNTVLTPCARNGIFRFWPYWANADADDNITTGGANPAYPSVDLAGNPVSPPTMPDGSPYVDGMGNPLQLQYASIYGRINSLPAGGVNADCSNITDIDTIGSGGLGWDPLRPDRDPTGFVDQVLGEMPLPNEYTGGDGLNTASFRWLRGREGDDDASGASGQGDGNDINRKQLNIKIDHVFNPDHKLAVNWSTEWDKAQNEAPAWQNGFWGSVRRRPHTLSANLNSTLTPTIVNEGVFGMVRQWVNQYEALDDPTYGDAARAFFPTINDSPAITNLSVIGNPFLTAGDFTRGNVSYRWTYRDNLSWTYGAHNMRFGGEARLSSSDGSSNLNLIPRVSDGSGDFDVVPGSYADFEDLFDLDPDYGNGDAAFFRDANQGGVEGLLLFDSASIDNMTQLFFLQDGSQLEHFENYSTEGVRHRDWIQHEAAFFAKDDWKVTRDLTLNLGLRWEYYGVPYEGNGLMPVPIGGGLNGGFGISGTGWNDWFQATPSTGDPLTLVEFVGPGSPNPDRALYQRDTNNFGPAVGFAWQVPWFGQGRTTVRGGYQVTYQGGGNSIGLDLDLGYLPGSVYTSSAQNDTPGSSYIRLADFMGAGCSDFTCLTTAALAVNRPGNAFDYGNYPYNAVVPLPQTSPGMVLQPLGSSDPTASIIPLAERDVSLDVWDDNYVSPYIQNFTLSVTRSLGRNMTVDVRYVGTHATKLFSNLAINDDNFLTNGLKEAFDDARAGIDNALLDQIFAPVRGSRSGSEYLRTDATFRTALAQGDYVDLAGDLANANEGLSGPYLGDQGFLLQAANVMAGGDPDGLSGPFPLNYMVANPQYNNVTLHTNPDSSTYHALQAQFTLRPTLGINYQGTFTWSRSMATPSGGVAPSFSFVGDRAADAGVQFQHRRLDFRSNGTFVLPLGPGKPLFGNSTGWVARVLEDWRFSAIFQMTTGRPNGITSNNRMYGGTANPSWSPEGYAYFGDNFFNWNSGKVAWADGADAGTFFEGYEFVRVPDPQCATVTTLPSGFGNTLQGRCTIEALTVVTGGVGDVPGPYEMLVTNAAGDQVPAVLILQNPLPFERGTVDPSNLEGVGLWLLNGSLAKSFQINEDVNLQVRFDATNLLNHPTPDDPGLSSCGGQVNSNLQLNSVTGGFFGSPQGPFGQIAGKCVGETPARRFQGGLRLTF